MTIVEETEQAQVKEPAVLKPVEEAVGPVKNYFTELANVNVNNHTEKKQSFTYLSWPYAVGELKKRYPDAKITVLRFPDPTTGMMVPYNQTPLGYFVEVAVEVNGVIVSEPFAVTDNKHNAIMKPTVKDINNSLQRAKVKSIAGHGLGLYIYAGEDVPVFDDELNQGNHNTNGQIPTNGQQNPYQNPYSNQQNPNQGQQQGQQLYNQIPLATQQQKDTIKNQVTRIVTMKLGENADPNVGKQEMLNIYNHFNVTTDMTADHARQVIPALSLEINGMLQDFQAQQAKTNVNQIQQQTPPDIFGESPPAGDLKNVL